MYSLLNGNACGIDTKDFALYATAAARAGFHGVDMPDGAFGSREGVREASDLLASLGLRWGLFHMPGELLSEAMDDARFEKALGELARLADRCSEHGCRVTFSNLWSGSDTMTYQQHYEWVCGRIAKINTLLKNAGVRYGVEALGPLTLQNRFRYPFINQLADAIALLAEIDPDMGFVFDTFHWYCMGGDPAVIELAAKHAGQILVCHINDALPLPIAQQQDLERGMPMEHSVIDSVEIVRCFLARGYTGPLTLEPLNPWAERLAAMDVDKAVSIVGDEMREFLSRLGRR